MSSLVDPKPGIEVARLLIHYLDSLRAAPNNVIILAGHDYGRNNKHDLVRAIPIPRCTSDLAVSHMFGIAPSRWQVSSPNHADSM